VSASTLFRIGIWGFGEMRFAPNNLYIEEYIKCANCGVLIYEKRGAKDAGKNPETITKAGKIYCSKWCLDWEEARTAKEANKASTVVS
jgi:hypothetical protein